MSRRTCIHPPHSLPAFAIADAIRSAAGRGRPSSAASACLLRLSRALIHDATGPAVPDADQHRRRLARSRTLSAGEACRRRSLAALQRACRSFLPFRSRALRPPPIRRRMTNNASNRAGRTGQSVSVGRLSVAKFLPRLRHSRLRPRMLTTLVITIVVGLSTLVPALLTSGSHAAATYSRQSGLWLAGSDGGVFSYGAAGYDGSTAGRWLNKPIAGMAATPNGEGYWLAASDGGIFNYGHAAFYGSTGGLHLNRPIVAIASTPNGKGYWLAASDGGIFSFGDAAFYGSTGGWRLNQPIAAMASTPDGKGYWLVASDGGIFNYGDARFYGSTGAMALSSPITAMAPTPNGKGYWLVSSSGAVYAYGDAGFYGSGVGPDMSVVAIAATSDGLGYWLVTSNGAVFPYGDATPLGTTAGMSLAKPVVAAAAVSVMTSTVARRLPRRRSRLRRRAAARHDHDDAAARHDHERSRRRPRRRSRRRPPRRTRRAARPVVRWQRQRGTRRADGHGRHLLGHVGEQLELEDRSRSGHGVGRRRLGRFGIPRAARPTRRRTSHPFRPASTTASPSRRARPTRPTSATRRGSTGYRAPSPPRTRCPPPAGRPDPRQMPDSSDGMWPALWFLPGQLGPGVRRLRGGWDGLEPNDQGHSDLFAVRARSKTCGPDPAAPTSTPATTPRLPVHPRPIGHGLLQREAGLPGPAAASPRRPTT